MLAAPFLFRVLTEIKSPIIAWNNKGNRMPSNQSPDRVIECPDIRCDRVLFDCRTAEFLVGPWGNIRRTRSDGKTKNTKKNEPKMRNFFPFWWSTHLRYAKKLPGLHNKKKWKKFKLIPSLFNFKISIDSASLVSREWRELEAEPVHGKSRKEKKTKQKKTPLIEI